MVKKNPRYTLEARRALRREMTQAETIIWQELRNRKFMGLKFRRQYGIGPFIFDFFNPAKLVAIEIDGKSHMKQENRQNDKNKEAFLRDNNIRLIRFRNDEVINSIDQVLLKIQQFIG